MVKGSLSVGTWQAVIGALVSVREKIEDKLEEAYSFAGPDNDRDFVSEIIQNFMRVCKEEGIKAGTEDKEELEQKYRLPIFEYPNDAKYARTLLGLKHKNVHGCSVTGGYVYRGKDIPAMYGKYIFGDYCTGNVWSFRLKNDKIIDFVDHTSDLLNSINKKKFYLSSFGEASDGELLLIDYSGSIYKLQARN